ncbi:MAG: tRNA (adenosine(37)-N6)-threonylcarbamoyltransferase complex ATPase subunit type 1 TsaE [Aphanocapsa lilacina HA4352-LM1]|nr:tRNA (adenosine(37)-N6)-threonylcarbamoyltransferase complex ATPase subunit type 1 TsaE [Aphanocapsa lilacina HA4352-LM1]
MKILLPDAEATRTLGARLAECWQPGVVLLFDGDLGAGKTTCIQGLAAALGIEEPVTSPTFALIEEYPQATRPLVHVDLYRLSPEEVPALGLEEMWDAQTIVAIEWAERLPFMPGEYLRIFLDWHEPRSALLNAHGPSAVSLLGCLSKYYRWP